MSDTTRAGGKRPPASAGEYLQQTAEAEAARKARHADGVRLEAEFRSAWRRLLKCFDAKKGHRLVDANVAGSALAGVGAILGRLGDVRTDMTHYTAEARLRTLAESEDWDRPRPGAPPAAGRVAVLLLLEAARGATAADLTAELRRVEASGGRGAFAWLPFYRDRLLPEGEQRATPAGAAVKDVLLVERALAGWGPPEDRRALGVVAGNGSGKNGPGANSADVLSAEGIAERYGLQVRWTRVFLHRCYKKDPDCRVEVPAPRTKKGEPRYVYRLDIIGPMLQKHLRENPDS